MQADSVLGLPGSNQERRVAIYRRRSLFLDQSSRSRQRYCLPRREVTWQILPTQDLAK
jgi:hypothetical protein